MKTLITLVALALLILTSCTSKEYKPFDAGVKAIQAELSLDSLDREVQLRNIKNN